jgi:uncharacterized protein (DUF2147 family)
MKLLMLAALLAAPAMAASAQSSDAVVGKWKTPVRNGVVEIQRCGASICGRLVTSDGLRANPDLRDANNSDKSLRARPLRGLQILSGFTADKDGSWNGGKIYNAEDGKTYTAYVTIDGPDTLRLKGCVFRPLCKTQTWTRVR